MPAFRNVSRTVRGLLLTAAAALLIAPLAQADEEASGRVPVPSPRGSYEEPVSAAPPPFVELRSTSIAAGIGMSWGDGTLTFEGQSYAFEMTGVSLLDVGFSVADSAGDVRNLTDIADFEGTYVSARAAGAAGVGGHTVWMRNDKGVEIRLSSQLKGLELALATQGFRISFK